MENAVKGLPVVAALGTFGMLGQLLGNSKNFVTKTGTVNEINARVLARGTLVTLLSAILLNVVGAVMAGKKVPSDMITTNYGFVLGPVIGYMLDLGIGTESGFDTFKKSKGKWIQLVFSSLAHPKFIRFVVTVLLDLFISGPLMDVMDIIGKPLTKSLRKEGANLSMGDKYSNFVADNFPSMLQSIVGFITFNAYTNQTRFNWAYADKKLPASQKISPFTICLTVSIGACLFASLASLHPDESERAKTGTKLMYSCLAIALLYGLNQFDKIDSKKDPDDKPSGSKTFIGIGVFIAVLIFGLVIPFMNAGLGGDEGIKITPMADDIDFSL